MMMRVSWLWIWGFLEHGTPIWVKTYQLTGVSSHFLPANDLILRPHLELKTWATPKNSQNWTYPIPTRWVSRDSPENSLAGWYDGGFMGAVVKFVLWPTSAHQWSCGWAWLLKQLGTAVVCVRYTPEFFHGWVPESWRWMEDHVPF